MLLPSESQACGADEWPFSAVGLGYIAAIPCDKAWFPHTLGPHGQSMQTASRKPCTPAIGRRTSRPSRTSREMLSPADADASGEEARDTCRCRCQSGSSPMFLTQHQPFG